MMVAERSDEKLVLAESHRGRASAQRVEGAYAVDPGHEVELKAIPVACNDENERGFSVHPALYTIGVEDGERPYATRGVAATARPTEVSCRSLG